MPKTATKEKKISAPGADTTAMPTPRGPNAAQIVAAMGAGLGAVLAAANARADADPAAVTEELERE